MKDMTGETCETKWCRGKYKETSIHDDWDGVLHCDKCGREVKRYRPEMEPK